jgi:hypothetical protein
MNIQRRSLRRALHPLRCLSLLLLLLAIGGGRAGAQVTRRFPQLTPSDTVYEVRLQDGSVLYGRVVSADAQRVVLVTQGGAHVELARLQIRSATAVRGRVHQNGSVWLEDPNGTRLFFGPTGRALRSGQGYVGAFELFLPFLSYGVTDWLTVAGGTPVIPEVIGRVVYVAPKVQLLATDRVHLSTGVLAFVNLQDEDFEDGSDVIGILYGAGTYGSRDNAVSFGGGWGFTGSDVENRPAFMLGGETRLSGRVKLITENYLISYRETYYPYDPNNPDPVPSYSEVKYMGLAGAGIRIFGERLAGDLGVGVGIGDADFTCCVPLVNFVYNFGGR